MLKAQLARALQPPMDTRSEHGLRLLQELDQELAADDAGEPPTAEAAPHELPPSVKSDDRDRTCDRVIAMLRARLAAR